VTAAFITFIFLHCKVKVKLPLSLTEYHTMKTYPLLNEAPHHEDIVESGGVAPHVFNFGTRWM